VSIPCAKKVPGNSSIGTCLNSPVPQLVHTVSATLLPGTDTNWLPLQVLCGMHCDADSSDQVPTGHVWQSVPWLPKPWNVPRRHAPHSRSLVIVGAASARSPALHVVTAVHVDPAKAKSGWKKLTSTPLLHGSHSRSLVIERSASTRVPAGHRDMSKALHSVCLCSSSFMYVPAGHGAQRLALVLLPSKRLTSRNCPKVQLP